MFQPNKSSGQVGHQPGQWHTSKHDTVNICKIMKPPPASRDAKSICSPRNCNYHTRCKCHSGWTSALNRKTQHFSSTKKPRNKNAQLCSSHAGQLKLILFPFAAFLRELFLPSANRCAQQEGQERSNKHWSKVRNSWVRNSSVILKLGAKPSQKRRQHFMINIMINLNTARMQSLLILFGNFLKWGYPQIIYFNGIFHQIHHPATGILPCMDTSIWSYQCVIQKAPKTGQVSRCWYAMHADAHVAVAHGAAICPLWDQDAKSMESAYQRNHVWYIMT